MTSPEDPAVVWLSTLDMEATQEKTLVSLVEGASRWILQEGTFNNWLEGCSYSPVLWVHGLPGSGNTTCTAVVIDHLVRRFRNAGSDTAVAYIYCDASNTELTAAALLASVCQQLAAQATAAGRKTPALLAKLHARLGGNGQRPGIDEVMLVLLALCEGFGRVFLCVDALDECPREDQRPLLLQKLLWLQGRDVRLFVSSATHGDLPEACRCTHDIESAMVEMEAVEVVVEVAAEDMRKGVVARLRERHPGGERLLADAGEDLNEVLDKIVRESEGMFIIAIYELDRKLREVARFNKKGDLNSPERAEPLLFYMRAAADYLEKHPGELSFRRGDVIAVTEADTEHCFMRDWKGVAGGLAGSFPKILAKKMENLDPDWRPDAMREVYGKWQDTLAVIENHQSRSRDTVMTVLCWLAHAEGPLTLDDLAKALSWDVTSPSEYRISWRKGGIEIEGADESTDIPSIFNVAKELLHFDEERATISVPDSLKPSDSELAALFPGGHYMIARMCLQILIRGLDAGKNTQAQAPGLMMVGDPGSRSYAERSWDHHAKLCKDDSIDELVMAYLTRRFESKQTWMEEGYMPFVDPYRVIITDDETPVLKAAKLGLNGVLKSLLQRRTYDLNAVSYKGETAMSVAVRGGHISTVKLLYRYGALVEAAVEYDDDSSMCEESLLEIAAGNNDDVMVALLIKLGPHKNTPLGSFASAPLESALSSKSVDAAKMLVMHGAEITDWHMLVAITSGRLELVEFIFERDDDSIAAMRDKDPAWKARMLSAAVSARSIPIAAYLIRNLGVSVGQLNDYQSSVVHEAASNHDFDMVKFLMDNTDDPMIPFREDAGSNDMCHGRTAVEAAIYHGYEPAMRTVEYLLERMPPSVPSNVILGIAAAALEREESDLSKRLIGMTTGPLEHARLTCEASLMGVAAAKNSTEILSILLDHTMSAGTQDQYGTSPLHVAAVHNCKEAAELIVSRGVDINMNATTTCGVTAVHSAVSEGHVETLRVLLSHGANPSLRAEDGSSALVAAGCSMKLDAARALLEYDVDVSDFNLDGETILHYAVLDGDMELARKLVDLGIDTSISSRRGGTALHLAAHKGNADMVRLLLDSRAQVDAGYICSGLGYEPPDNWPAPGLPWNRYGSYSSQRPREWCKIEAGWTPLHCAACSGHDDIAGMLISSSADILSTGHQGETPLHVAASAAHAAVVKLLVEKGADVNTKTSTGETPLHWAARAAAAVEAKAAIDSFKCYCQKHKDDQYERLHPDYSKSDCVDLLLSLGADAAAENTDGATPLVLAVAAGHGDVVDTLFKATKPATSRSAAYAELLHDITHQEKASSAAIAELSEAFSETAESQAAWCEVLGGACLAGKLDMAALAIYKGATLPTQTKDGKNPLHHIIVRELCDVVELVLSARCGANLDTRDSEGRNALHLAARHREESILGESTLTVNHQSMRRATIVQALLRSGAEPNARTPEGDTALHLAAEAGDSYVTETLLMHGASVDVRNKKGRTPLHAAVSLWAFPDIVSQLLGRGAHPSARDVDGYTPLHFIRESRNIEALNLLLEADAEILAAARNGDQPLHRAVRRGNWAVARRLVEVGADIAARGAKGRTCLHVAARYGHGYMVGELVAGGCKLEDIDGIGWKAAQHAVWGGSGSTIDALLQIGKEQSVDVFGAGVGAVPHKIS